MSTTRTGWVKFPEEKPEYGIELLGYHKEWIDEDFNPDGTRVCFFQGGSPDYWVIAKWCNYHDEWHTINSFPNDLDEEVDKDKKKVEAPTHWMTKPKPPEE